MPTFIQEAETAWNSTTSPKVLAGFDVQGGDLLVAISGSTDNGSQMVASDSSGLSWTTQEDISFIAYPRATVATAVAPSDISGLVVTFTVTGAGGEFCGGNVLTFRGGTPGVSDQNHEIGSPGYVSLSGVHAASAIVVCNIDGNGQDGAARVWRTTAGAFTELTYYRDTGWAAYGGYHANVASAGTYTVGQTAVTSQKFAIVALEIVDVPLPPPTPEQTDIITLTAAA